MASTSAEADTVPLIVPALETRRTALLARSTVSCSYLVGATAWGSVQPNMPATRTIPSGRRLNLGLLGAPFIVRNSS